MGTISRQTTWATGDTLTASDLNGEFDNILSTANGSLNADNLGVTAGQAAASKAVVLDSNKDFADTSSGNQIRNLTISGSLKIGTTFLPDASGGADLGSTSLEWGDVYIADDKKIYLGSDQDISLQYDETTNNALEIAAAVEGAALGIVLKSDQGDDAGDEWKLNIADGGTLTLGNDIASAGTYVTHLTLTPNSTVSSSTLALAGGLTVAGTAGITGVATVGGLTIGSAVINEAELETIDGITAGTVAASKAVVVDSNKDIGTFRNITIDGTFSDGNYTFDTSGNVSGLGTIGSGAITSSGVITGTGFTIGSAAINEAELETIDGVTAGTVAASKAVVVDSNKDIGSFRNVTLTGELDAATLDISGNADIDGTTNLDAVDIDGAVQVDATITVGADDQGYDIIFYGDTASANMTWDTSADDLILNGGAGLIVPDGQLTLGSTALAATAAELNVLDGVTAGTVAASKGVVVDANKDIGSFRNVTLTGELDAATLDISGNADIDGTTNLDVVDIDGAVQVDATVTVGVDDTGYDVKFFGATSGSSMLWDESADDLILTNAGLAVGSDATGDIYYRDANGFLARLAIGSDGQVLTSTGTVVNWEAAGGGGGGDFSGPGSATDNAVVRFDGTGGKTGQNSGVTIDDSNNATGFANLTITGELQTANIGYTDGDNAITIADGGGCTFPQDATFSGLVAAATMTLSSTSTISGDMTFVDNAKVTLGTGGDADIYYDGSNLVVTPDVVGNGSMLVDSDEQVISEFTTSGTSAFIVVSCDSETANDAANIAFNASKDSTLGSANTIAYIAGTVTQAHASTLKGDLRFFTNSGDSIAERMRVTDSGKVAIGAAAADTELHVHAGDAGHASVTDFTTGLTIEDDQSTGIVIACPASYEGKIYFADGGHQRAGAIIYNHPSDYLAFQTANTERMRINSSGEVGIGTSPSYPLHVVGNDSVWLSELKQEHTTPNGVTMWFSAADPDNNTQKFLSCTAQSTVRTSIYSDGDVWTSDAGTLTSDERLKTNIVDASDKLADVMRLKVRNYEWTPEYHPNKVGEKKIGFIAQELEEVFPSLITEHDIAADNSVEEQLYTAEDDTQYYIDGDEIPDGKAVGDVKAESQIPDGKSIGDVKVEAKAHEPKMRKSYKNAFAPILVKALQEVTTRLEAAEAKIAALEAA
mgnify:CR=1 FL=1